VRESNDDGDIRGAEPLEAKQGTRIFEDETAPDLENMTIALAAWHRGTWARVAESVQPCVSHMVIGSTADHCRILGP
jgi:hypothetical protein